MTKIVIIDGSQRSGTHLLLHYLEGHSQLCVLPGETALYSEMYTPEKLPLLRSIFEVRDFEALYEVMKKFWFFRNYHDFAKQGRILPSKGSFGKSFAFHFSMEKFTKVLEKNLHHVAHWTRGEVCRQILYAFWEAWKGKTPGDQTIIVKNHEAGLWLKDILREDPHLNVIHITRNPLDIISSQKTRHTRMGKWGPKRLLRETDKYYRMEWSIRSSPAGTLQLRYEDLIQVKKNTLTHVCEFLNIAYEEETFARTTINGETWTINSAYQSNDGGHIAKYKQSCILSVGEYRYILDSLRSHIKYWGYEKDCVSPLQYALMKLKTMRFSDWSSGILHILRRALLAVRNTARKIRSCFFPSRPPA